MREKRCLEDFPIRYLGFCPAVVTAWTLLGTDLGGACREGPRHGFEGTGLAFLPFESQEWLRSNRQEMSEERKCPGNLQMCLYFGGSCNSLAGAKGQKGHNLSPPLSPACLLCPAVVNCTVSWGLGLEVCVWPASLRRKTLKLKNLNWPSSKGKKN